ncbi:MAG: hypothetical protein ACRD4W_06985, partial [Nitrososphaeraceae archaeon]
IIRSPKGIYKNHIEFDYFTTPKLLSLKSIKGNVQTRSNLQKHNLFYSMRQHLNCKCSKDLKT